MGLLDAQPDKYLPRDRVSGALSVIETGRDLFGRQRVTLSNPQFTYQNEYNKGPAQWVEKIAGTAEAVHNPLDSTVSMTVKASGDKIIRQTRKYMRYFSGKTSSTITTWSTGGLPENVVFKVGYFDDHNGIFFKRTATGNSLVLRSSTVDTEVVQADWNGDKFDFDFSKSNIFQINLQWLGVGNVQCIFEDIDGGLYNVHTFKHVTDIHGTYMRTANLPIRYELEATGVIASDVTVKQICSTNFIEDGGCSDVSAYEHSVNNGTTAISVTTRRVVLAVRPKALFNAIVNRGQANVKSLDLLVGGNIAFWELVWNPTYAGTPTWTSLNDNSMIEYSVNATTITGGTVVDSGYAPVGSGAVRTLIGQDVASNYPLALDVDGATPTSFALVCTSFTGTSTVNGAMGIEEIY